LPRGEDAAPGHGSKGFDDTLSACLAVGLFDRSGESVRLHPDLPDEARDRRRHDQHFRRVFRDLVLREAANHGLWDSTEGARDLSRALAWYMAQNPLRPPGPWNEPHGVDVVQERQFVAGERVFSNDTRWGAFERWATFLGFAYHLPRDGKDVLVPDPTEVVREVVPSIVTARRQEIGAVIESLGHLVPVLDGGTYRREVEERLKPAAIQSDTDLLSPSLAHALLRLRDERVIVLEDLADAPFRVRIPTGFGPMRTITHASLAVAKPRSRQ